jgi:glutathione S-transferase
MKLYYSPLACSLADYIALREAGLSFEIEAVDIHTKRTESGADFHRINPKGYVPALMLDDGETITENIAVLDWIAEQNAALRPEGPLSRTRVLEMLTFISTEIHRAFKPLWRDGEGPEKQKARETVAGLLRFAATQMRGDYLFGDKLSVADCYLFVMVRWAARFGVAVPETLLRLRRRMETRPSVQAAMEQHEDSSVLLNRRPYRSRESVSPAVTATQ